MENLIATLRDNIEKKGVTLLRVSLGFIFLWFGFLKFFGDISAAESVASRTMSWLTADLLTPQISMPILAVIECIIGVGILTRKYMQFVIPLLYFQMAGTLLPLVVFPKETWVIAPIIPTLEGQYIIKNLLLISAGIVLGAVSKGAKLIRDPEIAAQASKKEQRAEEQ